jgi:hypothetical protein
MGMLPGEIVLGGVLFEHHPVNGHDPGYYFLG